MTNETRQALITMFREEARLHSEAADVALEEHGEEVSSHYARIAQDCLARVAELELLESEPENVPCKDR